MSAPGKKPRHVLISDEAWLPFKSWSVLNQIPNSEAIELLMISMLSHSDNPKAIGPAFFAGLQERKAK
jgi:hypothetical protein|nr:hypothetical protein [uncultured Dongia sp.]